MRKGILTMMFFCLLASTAIADVSVTILQGKAIGEKKAALFISVVDEAGIPVKGLSIENFNLLVGGEAIKDFIVEPVSATEEPLSVILAIDVSGSMRGEPFDETKKAVSIFLDQLDKGDYVSLMSFGAGVRFLTGFITERHIIREQMETLRPSDNWTHLYDATYEAIIKCREALTTRTVVILLTDGRPTGTQSKTREDAVDIASRALIPVFTIGFGHEISREYLEEIAQVSGGHFLFTPEAEKIPELYDNVLEQLKNQYIISFDFAKGPAYYRAKLDLTYGGEKAESFREFLFSPEGGIPWHEQLSKKERLIIGIFVGTVLLALLIVGFISVKRWNDVKKWRSGLEGHMPLPEPSGGKEECQLEYPEGSPTAIDYTNSISGSKTKLASGALGAFFRVDALKGQIVPFIYQGREVISELIVARRDEKTKEFKKGNVVYLWTPQKNNLVSRPNESRYGHIRVFFDEETERLAVEDLGSASGTLVNNNKLGKNEPFLLQDGDSIDVGGKAGIRIVYKEGDMIEEEESKIEGDINGTVTGEL